MNQELFKRKCPRCHKMVFYKSKYSRNEYRKRKLNCNKCKAKKENLSKFTIKRRRKSLKLVKHTWHNKISKNRIKNGTYKTSEETKEKHRINKIERMIKEGILIWPSFNKSACKIFKKLEYDLGLDGLYATKGKEKRIGRFWVDYYEPTKNIVIEYDESHHFDKNGNLKEKDVIRQKWIINKLKCKFYRIKRDTNYNEFKNILLNNLL